MEAGLTKVSRRVSQLGIVYYDSGGGVYILPQRYPIGCRKEVGHVSSVSPDWLVSLLAVSHRLLNLDIYSNPDQAS